MRDFHPGHFHAVDALGDHVDEAGGRELDHERDGEAVGLHHRLGLAVPAAGEQFQGAPLLAGHGAISEYFATHSATQLGSTGQNGAARGWGARDAGRNLRAASRRE